MQLQDRILKLFGHLGIERAHFAGGGFAKGLVESCLADSGPVASLTLVCPVSIPPALISDLARPLALISGDRGNSAGTIKRITADAPGVYHLSLKDYEPFLWSDVAADRTAEVRNGLIDFVGTVEAENPLPSVRHSGNEGNVAGIDYRLEGEGPPLALFPLGLSAKQWEPLLGVLAEKYCLIQIGGAYVEPISNLESRAQQPGHRGVVGSLLDHLDIRASSPVLEVGCGSGAITRWIAERMDGAGPVTAVDINRFLLREAGRLAEAAGLSGAITFQEANAEALPFDNDNFDAVAAVTVLEEVDAGKAIAEMARVTRPGGRVGVMLRSIDITPIVNVDLPDDIMKKVYAGLGSTGAAAKGCADASIYRRFSGVGLTDLQILPQFSANPDPNALHGGHAVSRLDPEERAAWDAAVAEAGANYFIAMPYHVAVGTKS